jgi:predicted MFS family arabinose efflux permease
MAGGEHAREPAQLPIWRNRAYMLLWSGQIGSAVGTGVTRLAFPLLVLALTGSPAQAGFISAARALPYVLLSLPAGALVDRLDRKRVMLVCEAGRIVALASIPVAFVLGRPPIALLYAVSLAEGVFYVFFSLAESASVPRLVSKEQLPTATVLNEATFSAQQLIGSPLGGVLFGIRQALPFVADTISYVVSFVSLLFIRAPFQDERSATPLRLREQIAEGVLWLWRQRLIRFMALMTGVGSLVFPGTTLVVIVLAQGQHASSGAIGAIITAGGIGGIVGIATTAYVQKRFRFGQIIITSGWLYALVWLLFAVAPTPLALGVVLLALGVVDSVYNIVQFGYRRALIPDALQGRVNSVFRLLLYSLDAIGLALTGILLQRVGPVATILLLETTLAAIALIATFNPRVRHAPPVFGTPAMPPAANEVMGAAYAETAERS